MRYAGIIKNDITGAKGVCVTFFAQGCPIHCPGCHNPEAQDFNGGKEFTADVITELKEALVANGVQRNLCIMGGEPLCPDNLFLTTLVIKELKTTYPDLKIAVWTGYTYEELQNMSNKHLTYILETIDQLVDGPYVEELRDVSLFMRGSSNQRVIDLKKEK